MGRIRTWFCLRPQETASQALELGGEPPPLPPLDAGLVPEHRAYVLGVLRRLGAPPADLEDVAQMVLVTAWRAKNPNKLAAGALLRGVTRFAWIWWRGRLAARRRLLDAQLLDAGDGASRETPEHELLAAEEQLLVRDALGELPETLQEVLVLAVMEEVPGPAIAETLQVPLNTAYTRIHRARAHFREALGRRRARQMRVPTKALRPHHGLADAR